MKNLQPKISLILLTYNRAHIVEEAIESVLHQTYRDFELILINNGSSDNTFEVVEKYRDNEKVRIFHLEKNIGPLGGLNFGFSKIKGEWFATLGDDDSLLEEAFETMIKIPEEVDPSINAVTCNVIASSTGKFAGTGLNRDQYLPIKVIVSKTGGDFFGITKTDLLGEKRFNEKLIGTGNALWYKIDVIANRYYIHKALKHYCTDEGNTETTRLNAPDVNSRIIAYRGLLEEDFYWEVLKRYNRKRFIARSFRGMWFLKINGETEAAKKYKKMLLSAHPDLKYLLCSTFISGLQPWLLKGIYSFVGRNKIAGASTRLVFGKYSEIS